MFDRLCVCLSIALLPCRSNAYLEISYYIAQFSEYTFALVDHICDVKLAHWDRCACLLRTVLNQLKRIPTLRAACVALVPYPIS